MESVIGLFDMIDQKKVRYITYFLKSSAKT